MMPTTPKTDALPLPSDASEAVSLRPEEQAAFVRSRDNVRRVAAERLAAHRTEASAVAFVRNLQDGVDGVVTKARNALTRIDCAAGCSHCCHARVEAGAPEIFRIVAEIGTRPADERAALLARLETFLATAPSHAAAWQDRPACPFLIDRLCSIYAVRPAACRKAHSTDVARCASHASSIPQDLDLALAAEALIHGTALAYADVGLDATRHELGGAVLEALRDRSLRARWFGGERVFEALASERRASVGTTASIDGGSNPL